MTRSTIVMLALALAACSSSAPPEPVESDADLAADAFVWGFPLVVTERTMQTLGALVGQNQLFNQSMLSNTTTRFIVSPNQDTLYSIAIVDLRSEPMVLTI